MERAERALAVVGVLSLVFGILAVFMYLVG